jgi:VanZ family protein
MPKNTFTFAIFGEPSRRVWFVTLALLLCAISYLALSPRPPAGLSTGWDKSNHALAFASLAFCGHWCLSKAWARWLYLPLLLIAYGGAIELLQMNVASRSAEWGDLLADSVGVAIGLVLAAGINKILQWRVQ